MNEYRLVMAEPLNPDLQLLVERLDRDLLNRYPAEEIFGLDFTDPAVHEVTFVVAYDGDLPVGCGAIRELDDSSAELKRFYVEPAYRNRGIAARIIRFLEKEAAERGYRTLRLEAGWEQPEAIGFYRKHGFCEIVRYGEYTGCESSVCFEKRIGSGNASYPIGHFKHEGDVSDEQRAVWIREIESLPVKLRMAVEGLTDTQLDTPYREGGWTVRQVVHHLADSHMNSMIRFKLALTEENPTVKPYAEARWAELEDSRLLPVQPSLQLLDALHQRWTHLLRSLPAEAYERTFFHPESKQTNKLAYVLGVYAWHGNHHVAHIRALRERMGWQTRQRSDA